MRASVRQLLFGRGPEMVANGSLLVSADGWTVLNAPTLSYGASGVTIQNAGATYGVMYQTLRTIIGRTYICSVEIDYTGPGFARMEMQVGAVSLVGSSGVNTAVDGVFSFAYVATSTVTSIVIGNRNDSGAVSAFKNVSVRRK